MWRQRGLLEPSCGARAVYTDVLILRRADKEIVCKYSSDSSTIPVYNSDSYEFNFGLDPIEPESDYNYAEKPLPGLVAGLVIKSTPAGRFVYLPDQKPANLTLNDNSCCIAYLETLPFKEGTPLSPNTAEHTPDEVSTIVSGRYSPDHQVFIVEVGETSTNREDQYLDDISDDELSADAPADETTESKNARRTHNESELIGVGDSRKLYQSAT
jgi:hypothetical protein